MVLRVRLLVGLAAAAVAVAACSGSGFSGAVPSHQEPAGEDAGSSAEADGSLGQDSAAPPLTCKASRADCNSKTTDGCEVDTSSNPKHCGGCNRACSKGEVCAAGKCAATCPSTLKNCSGACVDQDISVEHCGKCDQACPAPTNGTAVCEQGQCAAECNANFEACATGCCPKDTPPPPPTVVPGASVAAGNTHSCAITSGGGLKCWGGNSSGRIGDNTQADRKVATQVMGLTSGVVAVGAGTLHTCALLASGAVQCWGSNSSGQLGAGDQVASKAPREVLGITDAVSLAVGRDHSCVIVAGGGVKCWGANSRGQLGDGSKSMSDEPVDALGLPAPAVALALGEMHTCALLDDSTVTCWGGNDNGQLGDGTVLDRDDPTPVLTLPSNVTTIAAGLSHTCAVAAGKVWCWGANANGQLGDGTNDESHHPLEVGTVTDAIQVDAGAAHTCAVESSGGIKCWGLGTSGQLGGGAGNNSTSFSPIAVATLGAGGVLMKEVAGGGTHTCARTQGDNIKCWGLNSRGQLGNGTATSTATPVNVQGM